MACVVIRPKTREEWLELRKGGIGSSEVATLLGLNNFETPFQLWLRKTGQVPPQEENFAMKRGHFLEDAVAQYYEDATGRQIIKRSRGDWIMRDKERPYLQVSPDRTYWLPGEPHSNANKGIVEIKTTRLKVDPEDLPLKWVSQLVYQLGVAGWRSGSLAWLDGNMEFGYVDIPFDKEYFEFMAAEAEHFMEACVRGGEEPLPVSVEDILIKSPASREGLQVPADAETREAVLQLRDLKDARREADARADELEARIKLAMGDAEALLDPSDGRTLCTWRTAKPGARFDERRFKAEHPAMHAAYMRETTGSRRFLLK